MVFSEKCPFFPVSRFKAHVVFYRPVAGGIEIVRVLHGARDIDGVLAEEFGVDTEAEAGDDGAEEEANPGG